MLILFRRWLFRGAAVLAVGFVAFYLGDWVAFRLRGSPMSKVTVDRYMSIPLKNNKQEVDYLGTMEVPCSISLFPEGGESPCWKLRRNTSQTIKM